MRQILTLFLLAGILFLSFSQTRDDKQNPARLKDYYEGEALYQQALRQIERAGDDEASMQKADTLFLQALAAYNKLSFTNPTAIADSLHFNVLLRKGYIRFFLDSTTLSQSDYLQAFQLKKTLPWVKDSELFRPYLYMGRMYYDRGLYDSAQAFYKMAETINDSYKDSLPEAERLYNGLGALYFGNGNYQQARNYFNKAIAALRPNNNSYKSLLANYKNNVATILLKLEDYTTAQAMYESMLPNEYFANQINQNLGIISLRQNLPLRAIDFFRKVNYDSSKANIELYYNFALAHSKLNNTDSASFWIHKAIAENIKWNGQQKNITNGLILKYQGDVAAEQRKYKEAAALHQQAIMQFDARYKESSVLKNPETFTAVFSYINLFNSLTAKADVLKKIYDTEKDVSMLLGALDAYRAAFKLADYVGKTYNSDEARLFLGKIKNTVHSKPIDISLELFEKTKRKDFLEETYLFDQRNKASVLALNVQDKELKNQTVELNEMVIQESRIKSNITRLSLQAARTADTFALQNIYSLIRDNEIELGKLQEKLQADPLWQQKIAGEIIPSVGDVQKKLDHTTTLLSFQLSDDEILVLLISANQFEYYKTPVNKNFFDDIEFLTQSLYSRQGDVRYAGAGAATSLYNKLLAPLHAKLQQKKRLIIIPDDELNFLPFEVLQDENKKYLVEKFAVQYQFTTALLGNNKVHTAPANTLAFAPFAASSYKDSTGIKYSRLVETEDEVKQLKGKVLMNQQATKKDFIDSANHFRFVHLATHASVNNEDPMQSYIAFYPGNNSSKLYAREIYDMKLDSLQLIILSACETGSGQLVKGEGLMSLSRAFTYAGCPNIITSLWKAEDKTTAYLTSRLHFYLDKKYTKDQALQQAKADLLKNPELDARYKAPNYWAHLIFIGNYEANHTTNNWWWIALTMIGGAIVYKFFNRKKPR